MLLIFTTLLLLLPIQRSTTDSDHGWNAVAQAQVTRSFISLRTERTAVQRRTIANPHAAVPMAHTVLDTEHCILMSMSRRGKMIINKSINASAASSLSACCSSSCHPRHIPTRVEPLRSGTHTPQLSSIYTGSLLCTFALIHCSTVVSIGALDTFYPRDVVSICYGDVAGWVSVTRRYSIKTAKPILKRFKPSGSSIILVSSDTCDDTQFQGEPLQRGVK